MQYFIEQKSIRTFSFFQPIQGQNIYFFSGSRDFPKKGNVLDLKPKVIIPRVHQLLPDTTFISVNAQPLVILETYIQMWVVNCFFLMMQFSNHAFYQFLLRQTPRHLYMILYIKHIAARSQPQHGIYEISLNRRLDLCPIIGLFL